MLFLYPGFNTSHVTVYHSESRYTEMTEASFNTSHVTVYPLWTSVLCQKILVSIHLMLRFISEGGHVFGLPQKFQYISCYGLSQSITTETICRIWFQYISCYGLSTEKINYVELMKQFQYISCYGLSENGFYRNRTQFMFQYISCYGLSLISRNF